MKASHLRMLVVGPAMMRVLVGVMIVAGAASSAQSASQLAKLTASDGADGDIFGVSVSISGDTVVIGAPRNADAGSYSGSAYVFQRDQGGADNWGQVAK
ncbi:MAG: FG-GAP repeat protein, partial [Phycisphaerae bacterium]|nr:FG-GAP repeat protein [Phycisphaerae bacterium]